MDSVFVLNWYHAGEHVFFEGISNCTRTPTRVEVDFSTSLFLWSRHDENAVHECLDGINKLSVFANCFKIIPYDKLNTDDISSIDILNRVTTNYCHKKCYRCYIVKLENFWKTVELYKIIIKSTYMLKMLHVPAEWSFEIMVMLFTYPNKNYTIWYGNNSFGYMNVEIAKPSLKPLIIVFDIETVSHLPNRVPTGEYVSDIIFSISLEIIENDGTVSKYIMCNIPNTNKQSLITEKFHNYTTDHNYHITFFNNEQEMIVTFLELLHRYNNVYTLLVGYNSISYDSMFLMKRCVYHNMNKEIEKYFHLQGNVITFGKCMYHIDLYRFVAKFHRFNMDLKDFKLNTVSSFFLNKKKVDVDMKMFFVLYKNSWENGELDDSECEQLANVLFYNSVDTSLLTQLLEYENIYKFLEDNSKSYNIKISKIPTSESCEFLRCKTIGDCLNFKTLLSYTPPESVLYAYERFYIRYKLKDAINFKEEKLNLSLKRKIDDDDDDDKLDYNEGNGSKNQYKGGMNYCYGKHLVRNVMATDYTSYYPYLIEGFNLSFDTTSILPSRFIVGDFRRMLIENQNNDEYRLKFVQYNNHDNMLLVKNNQSLSDPNILKLTEEYMYIKGLLPNCNELDLSVYDDLKMKSVKHPVVVLSAGKTGVLYKIIERQNTVRDLSKVNLKNIKGTLDILSDVINEMQYDDITSSDDSSDDDDDDDDAMATRNHCRNDIMDFINKNINELDFEINNVSCKYRLLNKSEMKTFTAECLQTYHRLLKSEYINIMSQYRLLKIINNGIYGRLGASFGCLSSIQIAAVITMLGRKYIFETAKVGSEFGFETLLIDTDSVFLYSTKNDCKINNVVNAMRNTNNKLVLNCKIYDTVFTMGKKTYIYKTDVALSSKGVMKNVSPLLFEVYKRIYGIYVDNYEHENTTDVFKILESVYEELFERVKTSKHLVTFEMNVKGSYKTDTPIKKLMDRVKIENPYYQFDKKVSYFYKYKNIYKNVYLELAEKLDSTEICDINLYKFMNKINKVIYNIISMYLYHKLYKLKGTKFMMSYKDFDIANGKAYTCVRERFRVASI